MKNGDQPINPNTLQVLQNEIGLTKREYFAGLAMQGMLSIPNTGLTCDGITKRAVEAADSLLKQLDNEPY